jgi:hypothetical protein
MYPNVALRNESVELQMWNLLVELQTPATVKKHLELM